MPRIAPALALAFAVTLAAGPALAADGPATTHAAQRALVQRVLRAYGGVEALERVKAYRIEGNVFSMMRHADTPTVRVFQRPDRFKALVDYEHGAEARLARGHDVWRNEPGGPLEPAAGPMWAAVLLQALRADLPWLLAEHESEIVIDGDQPPPAGVLSDADARKKLLAITVPIERGLVFRAWLDADGLVVVSQGLLDHGGMRTHFETVYTDYRDVAGVQFAYHEDNWASGMRTGVTTVKKVVVNPKLRDDEFTPPAPVPGEGRGD